MKAPRVSASARSCSPTCLLSRNFSLFSLWRTKYLPGTRGHRSHSHRSSGGPGVASPVKLTYSAGNPPHCSPGSPAGLDMPDCPANSGTPAKGLLYAGAPPGRQYLWCDMSIKEDSSQSCDDFNAIQSPLPAPFAGEVDSPARPSLRSMAPEQQLNDTALQSEAKCDLSGYIYVCSIVYRTE